MRTVRSKVIVSVGGALAALAGLLTTASPAQAWPEACSMHPSWSVPGWAYAVCNSGSGYYRTRVFCGSYPKDAPVSGGVTGMYASNWVPIGYAAPVSCTANWAPYLWQTYLDRSN